jgi:hypothetical protein
LRRVRHAEHYKAATGRGRAPHLRDVMRVSLMLKPAPTLGVMPRQAPQHRKAARRLPYRCAPFLLSVLSQ